MIQHHASLVEQTAAIAQTESQARLDAASLRKDRLKQLCHVGISRRGYC